MLETLVFFLIAVSVLAYSLYFRPQKIDCIQIGLAGLVGFLLVIIAYPLLINSQYGSDLKQASSIIIDRLDYTKSGLYTCMSPFTDTKKYSVGCSGGCVSDGRHQPDRSCDYEGPHDCIGTIKQKIARYLLSSNYLDHTRYLINGNDFQPRFLWPLRRFFWSSQRRIIQGFSDNGNDGINISVPEGTQVIAAEGGYVAYAGSELKGYGDMILIRHPNGFVSAYAHNSELMVKKGDEVERGQVIAKSGKSGSVGSPQLHFEIRRGSNPVDPIEYLERS